MAAAAARRLRELTWIKVPAAVMELS